MRLVKALVVVLAVVALVAPPAAAVGTGPGDGPGGPVLVVVNPSDQFGHYYAEILRAEGLNAFAVADTNALTPETLANYQVVILGHGAVSGTQAAALTGWVGSGGNLIAMRPDASLAGLLGLGAGSGSLDNAYMRVDTGSPPGAGITGETMQYHGTADRWTLAGASTVATLYGNATTATANPAVTLRTVGSAGGQAAAFTYDLARSVVYTRQGNPAWAHDERDHALDELNRSDDLFYGPSPEDPQTDWVNLDKVAIPQADEQQRLLANLVTEMNLDRTPLPRFWYLPRGAKAAFVMTGDDHAVGGTAARFTGYENDSPPGCSVPDWACIRATSYVFPNTSVPGTDDFQTAGFEIGAHVNTGCANHSLADLRTIMADQLASFASAFPAISRPRTNRNHCIAWDGWVDTPRAEAENRVRLDTNYYYWPGSWVQNRSGMFTGSGFPMRFADTDGSLIDVYQATTQLTDESDIDIGRHAAELVKRALDQGYYGVFTANMHTDLANHPGSNAIVAVAKANGVPVISAAQLLDWTDGRNNSLFTGLGYVDGRLTFGIVPGGAGAGGLEAMIPAAAPRGGLSSLTLDGQPVTPQTRNVKGILYAVFPAAAGGYVATYGPGAAPLAPEPTRTAVAGVISPRAAGTSARTARLVGRRVRATRSGKVTLRVRCPRGESRCRITLRIRKGRKQLVHRRTVSVKPGATKTVTLRLTRSARARLARARSMKVDVLLTTRTGGSASTTRRTRIRLLAPRR